MALSAFVKESNFSMPQLSPDGKYIALTVRTPGAGGHYTRSVTIYSLPEMKVAGAIGIPKFHMPTRYFWTGPTRLFLTTAMESAPGQADVYSEVVAIEIDGSKQNYLYGYGKTFRHAPRRPLRRPQLLDLGLYAREARGAEQPFPARGPAGRRETHATCSMSTR